MKKAIHFVAASALLTMLLLPEPGNAGVRVYVRLGPPKVRTVKVVRPAKPYRKALWVDGHYVYKHGHYVWVGGKWLEPRVGFVYIKPHWRHTDRGYYFVPGHWVKR